MEHIKKINMICFNIAELAQLIKDEFENELKQELSHKKYCLDELYNNKQKMKEISDSIISKKKNKEFIEIFESINLAIIFYRGDSKIFFPLKDSINREEINIKNFDDLKKITKEDSLTDFAIYSNGLRLFQLKQYPHSLDTDTLFNFISNKIKGYGSLGDHNLIIILQGTKDQNLNIDKINFDEINKKIQSLSLSFKGEILLEYNEENKFNVINQVYPELTTCRRKIDEEIYIGKFFAS